MDAKKHSLTGCDLLTVQRVLDLAVKSLSNTNVLSDFIQALGEDMELLSKDYDAEAVDMQKALAARDEEEEAILIAQAEIIKGE